MVKKISAFSESQIIQRESLRNGIRFLNFQKKLRHFKVKVKILYLINEYRNTNGQNSKATEGKDSFNEYLLNYKFSIRLKVTTALNIFLKLYTCLKPLMEF